MMKPYLLALIFFSCSKEQIEKPVERSITYQIHRYDTKHTLIAVDTSIHWCRVGGEELARFEAITRRDELICDGGQNRLMLVIGEACKTEHKN